MADNYVEAPGNQIQKDFLKISKAKEVVNALEKLPYVSFLECRTIKNSREAEVIVFETEVEVGQRTVHDIRKNERIAVIFDPQDISYPEVLALREDFPIVPHLNLRIYEIPRSLCLSDEKYSEFKLRWTPTRFIELIRRWLALNAKGELHAEDQPLEPLLLGNFQNLIIPFDVFHKEKTNEFEPLIVRKACFDGSKTTYIAEWKKDSWLLNQKEMEFIAIPILGKPQPHGIIHRQPRNLLELSDFLLKAKIDLLSELRMGLIKINNEKQSEEILNANLILITCLPKTRHGVKEPETSDIWSFILDNSIKEIGVKIGIWQITDGMLGSLLPPDKTQKGERVNIELLKPHCSFSRELASKSSGLSKIGKREIIIIGAGALGSQLFMNFTRMGYGKWTIVDDDCLLPHNCARHALSGIHIGFAKAQRLADEANLLIKGDPIAEAIVADVLTSSNMEEKLKSRYKQAQIIIDASASVPVARYLARDIDSSARRLSVFLTPSGNDLVILAEDENRAVSLDYLEMQYYRFLINNSTFEDHLKINGNSIRYARSCGDISNVIPQDLVALHSAICCRGIRNAISSSTTYVQIWKVDPDDMGVKSFNVPFFNVIERKHGDWTVCADQYFFEKISKARANKLPNETGGILIGSFDTERKIIYVVDAILSPLDSTEQPTYYKRGYRGLKRQIQEIEIKTANMLSYIGEWHSHPPNSNTMQSEDDLIVISWLKGLMEVDGLPALMLIKGDNNRYSWHIK